MGAKCVRACKKGVFVSQFLAPEVSHVSDLKIEAQSLTRSSPFDLQNHLQI